MDLDEMMNRIFVPGYDQERKEARALAEYTDVRIQYGENSPEEQKVYAALVERLPKMQEFRDGLRAFEACIIKEYQSLPEDERTVEAVLKKLGFEDLINTKNS